MQAHRFSEDKKAFEQITQEQRSAYRVKLLELQPQIGKPTLYKRDYPNCDTWEYQKVQFNYYFIKVDNPKAVMFYFHGMNSHGGSSGYLGTELSQKCNIDVYALDFKNFGKSKGDTRGLISSFDESVAEADNFVEYITSKYKAKMPIVIAGLSFGGSISLRLATLKPQKYSLLIMLSPGLRQVKQSQFVMKQVGKAIGFLFPTLQLVSPKFKDGNKFDLSEQIMADPLNYTGSVLPGSIRAVLNGIQEVENYFKKLETPYILFQSGKDKLVDVFAPLDLQKQSPSKDKTTIYCKQMWHSVLSEQQIVDIVPIISEWIQKRI